MTDTERYGGGADYKSWIQRAYDWVAEARLAPSWSAIHAAGEPVTARLLDLARLGPGQSCLDLGCGVGEPALSAAARVGPTGRVIALDLSARSLDIARARACERGISWLEFHEQDMEHPPFAEGAFDAVISRWSLMLSQDLPAALERIRGVLVRDGRLAIALIGGPHGNSVAQAAASYASFSAHPPGHSRPRILLCSVMATGRGRFLNMRALLRSFTRCDRSRQCSPRPATT